MVGSTREPRPTLGSAHLGRASLVTQDVVARSGVGGDFGRSRSSRLLLIKKISKTQPHSVMTLFGPTKDETKSPSADKKLLGGEEPTQHIEHKFEGLINTVMTLFGPTKKLKLSRLQLTKSS